MTIDVSSEIGHLEGVILHRPGIEIEKMVPNTIEECSIKIKISPNFD